MPRVTRDYGLPRLTITEAARILGIAPYQFMDWLVEHAKATPAQWANWRAERGPGLPEAIIRVYLTQQAEAGRTARRGAQEEVSAQAPSGPPSSFSTAREKDATDDPHGPRNAPPETSGESRRVGFIDALRGWRAGAVGRVGSKPTRPGALPGGPRSLKHGLA